MILNAYNVHYESHNTLWSKIRYYSPYTDEETEAYKSYLACRRTKISVKAKLDMVKSQPIILITVPECTPYTPTPWSCDQTCKTLLSLNQRFGFYFSKAVYKIVQFHKTVFLISHFDFMNEKLPKGTVSWKWKNSRIYQGRTRSWSSVLISDNVYRNNSCPLISHELYPVQPRQWVILSSRPQVFLKNSLYEKGESKRCKDKSRIMKILSDD